MVLHAWGLHDLELQNEKLSNYMWILERVKEKWCGGIEVLTLSEQLTWGHNDNKYAFVVDLWKAILDLAPPI